MLKLNLRMMAGLVLLAFGPFLLTTPGLADGGNKKKGKKKKGGDDDSGESYQAPYGMAGCGLGSVIIKDDSFVQVFAVTSNGTGFQTSAISCSHSSNCKPAGTKEAAETEQEVFVAANINGLQEDVSTGGGSYSYAFAQVLGCDSDDNYGEFLEISRANYQDIFSSADPQVVYAKYLNVLRSDAKLSSGCERVEFKS